MQIRYLYSIPYSIGDGVNGFFSAAREARMWDAVRWPNQLFFSVVRSTWRLYLSKSTSIREYFFK